MPWLLCALAAARVLLACAAFPLFNSSDEQLHFDMVRKYALGKAPRTLEPLEPESARAIAVHETLEYVKAPEAFADSRMPAPAWERTPADGARWFLGRLAFWDRAVNLEANQSPLYYAVAGGWYRLGLGLGWREGDAIYWIRLLNAAVAALLVGLAFLWGRRLFPEEPAARWGLPLLAAVFPQDCFYGITNDVLSPLLFGAAFLCSLEALFLRERDPYWQAASGLLAGAAILVKWPNVAILPVLALFAAVRRPKRADWPRLLLLPAAAAAVPVLLWCAWKLSGTGHVTGYGATIEASGWTLKPWTELLDHPLFTWGGARYFLASFFETFWLGEYLWHGKPLRGQAASSALSLASCVLLAAAAVSLRGRRSLRPIERAAHLGSFAALGVYLAQLAFMSVRYDFGDYTYPSRELPFLYSGRLALGAMLPLLALQLRGVSALTSRLSSRSRLALLGVAAAAILGGEALGRRRVLASRYNWFHLPSAEVTAAFERPGANARVRPGLR